MNKTSCPHVSFDFAGRFLPPVYILVFIIGLTANVIGLKTLLQNWTKLKIINVFVLNLGLADILYLLTLPFLVVYHLKKSKWIFGDTFCKITRFCFNINLYGSIGFLTCISVSRYLAIVHPFRVMGRLTASHSVVVSVLVWILVSVQCLPDMFFIKTYRKGVGKCYDTTSKAYVEEYLKYSVGWTVTGFCLPFLVTVGCYTHVMVKLCGSSFTDTDRLLKRKSLRLLLVLILLFSVCYIPYHVLRNLNLCSRVLLKRRQCYSWFDPVYVAHQVGRGLVCLNPALNPLVYLHVSDELSSGLRVLMGRTRRVLDSYKMSSIIGHASLAQAPPTPAPSTHASLAQAPSTLVLSTHATPEHTTPEHVTPEHNTPEHVTPEHNTPEHATPEHTTPEHTTPEHVTPEHVTPEHTTPEHTTPEHTTPEHTTPEHTTPEHATPEHATPEHTMEQV